jgi:hypothetical protein
MQLQNSRLKTVGYRGIGDPPNPRNVVAYMRYDDGKRVVFTGLYNSCDGPRGSTCNFAEDIVFAIALNEHLDPHQYEFYDLKTMRSYGTTKGPLAFLDDYQPGSFNFDKLHPYWKKGQLRPYHMTWSEHHIDEVVACDFAEFIWGDSERGPLRNLAVAHGALKPQEPIATAA